MEAKGDVSFHIFRKTACHFFNYTKKKDLKEEGGRGIETVVSLG